MWKHNGYSIIELVVVLAGLSLLTSIAITRFNSFFKYLELDETFAHVNEISAQCLQDLGNNSSNSSTAAVVDSALLSRTFFEINGSYSNCHYFELKPKTAGGENDLRFGFGIYKGKVTKFAVSNSDSMDTECERWAGNLYCIKNASSSAASGYNTYFEHMEASRKERIKCETTFKGKLSTHSASTPVKRWDIAAESTCPLDAKENSDTSYKTTTCTATSSGCTKDAYIYDKKFVGYTNDDYTAAESAECSTALTNYLDSPGYEERDDLTLAKCPGKTFFTCNKTIQSSRSEWETCMVKSAIDKCAVDLETKRRNMAGNGPITVITPPPARPGANTYAPPPCGKNYYVCNQGVYDSQIDARNAVGPEC